MIRTSLLPLLLLLLASCNPLSERARDIAGDYYIPQISEEMPLLELGDDGRCRVRAVRPGVLTYHVTGRWNVEGDSLLLDITPGSLVCEGDSTLVGDVPQGHVSRYIRAYDGLQLTLDLDGVPYVYRRRHE